MVHGSMHAPELAPPTSKRHRQALEQARTQNHSSVDQALCSWEVAFAQRRVVFAAARCERFLLSGFQIPRMYVVLSELLQALHIREILLQTLLTFQRFRALRVSRACL